MDDQTDETRDSGLVLAAAVMALRAAGWLIVRPDGSHVMVEQIADNLLLLDGGFEEWQPSSSA
jgi:predicted RNA binding protein YcfA (HicA-like mRNA interferase family)